jgi:bifunctional enzyme CysN/CysC/sulfate adenylyltransferase subunit 1
VQWVNRPNNPTDKTLHDFRGFSGQIAGGIVKVGQEVLVLPSGRKSFVKEIQTFDGNLDEAFSPQSVTLVLEDDLDISRGDMIVGTDLLPGHSADISARVCWMEQRPLQVGQKYFLKHGTQTVQAKVISLDSRINIQTYEPEPHPAELAMNDIGEVRLRTAKPLVFDAYTTNRLTGSIVLVEPSSNATAAAGMLRGPEKVYQPDYDDFMI